MHEEFLKESEGSLQGERSVPELHCCSISSWGGGMPQVVSGCVRDKLLGTSYTIILLTLHGLRGIHCYQRRLYLSYQLIDGQVCLSYFERQFLTFPQFFDIFPS